MYYINWEDGTRTTVDPRAHNRSFYLYNSSSDDEDPVTDPEESEGEAEGEAEAEATMEAQQTSIYNSSVSDDTDSCSGINTESSYTSNISSNRSSFSPTESSSSGGFGAFSGASGTANGGAVLVAAGCKACFMYFMVPKHVNVCPKCGGAGLLHLGRA